MGHGFQVKGSVLSTKFAFVRHHFGEKKLAKVFERVTDLKEEKQVLDSAWYPFSSYDQLLLGIAEVCFGRDLKSLRKVGEFSAEKALTGVYRGFVSGGTFADFIKKIGAFQSTIYNMGTAKAEIEDRRCSLSVRQLPTFSQAEAEVNSGYLAKAARRFGHPNASAAYELHTDGATYTVQLS